MITLSAAVLAVAGGSLNDMYNPVERGYAFPVYAGAGFLGPMAAPVIGTAISQFWDWRWNYYLCGIVGIALSVGLSVACPETLVDIILFEKAKRLWKRSQREEFEGPRIRKPMRKQISPAKFLRSVFVCALLTPCTFQLTRLAYTVSFCSRP
jgi:MFS family permease